MGDQPEKIDAPPSSHNVVKVAQEGFGKNAAAYDANRPGYLEDVVQLILDEIPPPSTGGRQSIRYDVLELGAGTGKLTERVAPKLAEGCRYMATEPSENFLDCLRAKGLTVDSENWSACPIPLPDNSVQTVLCGQSLHWFSNKESFQEIHRVLVPGGKLIPVWNMKKFEDGQWMMEFYKQRLEVMERTDSSPLNWVNSMEWKKALDACGLFSCVRHESLPGIDFDGTLDVFLSHLRTISCYNVLPSEVCQAYIDSLKAAILRYPDVDPNNVTVPFTSEMYVFKAIHT